MVQNQDPLDFSELERQAQAARKRMNLVCATLRQEKWEHDPLRQERMNRAIREYTSTCAKLQAEAEKRVSAAEHELESDADWHASVRAERLVKAFEKVPGGAVDLYARQVERMTPAERLEAYKRGEKWQKFTIASVEQATPEPEQKPGEVYHADPARFALASAIDQFENTRNVTDVRGQVVRTERLLGAREIAEGNRAIASAKNRIATLDPESYDSEIALRFTRQPLPLPTVGDFAPEEIQATEFQLGGLPEIMPEPTTL
jgi:hypothetical protein